MRILLVGPYQKSTAADHTSAGYSAAMLVAAAGDNNPVQQVSATTALTSRVGTRAVAYDESGWTGAFVHLSLVVAHTTMYVSY